MNSPYRKKRDGDYITQLLLTCILLALTILVALGVKNELRVQKAIESLRDWPKQVEQLDRLDFDKEIRRRGLNR